MDRPGAVAELRRAVSAFTARHSIEAQQWYVALSGGADSLALTAVAARLRSTVALVVEHGLQADSRAVAETARRQALELGCVGAKVLRVVVGRSGGPEAAARAARYAALAEAGGGAPVLLGHTLDDQAETVLLGLGRGSGPRSIAGMRAYQAPWCRPLLTVRRKTTRAACAELDVKPWHDPHNFERRFTRARVRLDVLPLLEDALGGGVAEALARTAEAVREDCDLLDELARQELAATLTDEGLDVASLHKLPEAIRRRVVRSWLQDGGATDLTDNQIRRVDALITAWHGQGGVAVGSALHNERLVAGRADGVLRLHREPV